MEIMRRLVQEEEGQGMVEYALIIALIAIVAMAAIEPIGKAVHNMFGDVTTKLGGTAPTDK